MVTRTIRNANDIEALCRFLGARKMPVTVDIKSGRSRTTDQNRLQRKWVLEAAEQLGDRTPEEVRGETKLRLGVPILRLESEEFREKYDRIIRPLPYAQKLELMMEPFDFPVTRLMSVDQKSRYLNDMHRYW